jgi:methylamine---glutamate N-methyltransferase subunit A
MCGLVGLLLRDPALEPELGSMLVPMIEALDERGPNSSGIGLYSHSTETAGAPPTLHVSLGSDVAINWSALGDDLLGGVGSAVVPFGAGVVVDVPVPDLPTLRDELEAKWPEVRVLGTGQHLQVLKDTGRPTETCARYEIKRWGGYMAVAHTRMATESAVTVLHAHPFVPTKELCVVHNGSFSNYATVRRRLRSKGVRFDSDNDSEVAARFLATRLAAGDDLGEAIRWVMKEMDGFFTMVISTDTELSVVRDTFACKPAVVAETAGYVAVASEYRALAELPGIAAARVFEPQPEEVYTWSR